jgi:hypothetical protein
MEQTGCRGHIQILPEMLGAWVSVTVKSVFRLSCVQRMKNDDKSETSTKAKDVVPLVECAPLHKLTNRGT